MEFVLGTFVEVSFFGNEMHTRCSFNACCLAPNSVNAIREPVVPRWYFDVFMLEDKYSQIPRDIFNFLPCLGTFALLWKMTIRFFITVRPHGTTRLPLDGFLWHVIFWDFSKMCWENSFSLEWYQQPTRCSKICIDSFKLALHVSGDRPVT